MSQPTKDTASVTPRAQDYPQWYLDVIKRGDLAENSAVRGCMVIKPHGYAIWEKMQRELDDRFKATGHVNAYFPLFIPLSFLTREEQHASGFAKECAVVTHHRQELPDERPASRNLKSQRPAVRRTTKQTASERPGWPRIFKPAKQLQVHAAPDNHPKAIKKRQDLLHLIFSGVVDRRVGREESEKLSVRRTGRAVRTSRCENLPTCSSVWISKRLTRPVRLGDHGEIRGDNNFDTIATMSLDVTNIVCLGASVSGVKAYGDTSLSFRMNAESL